MMNIQDLIDGTKCTQSPDMRPPDGVARPHCSSTSVVRNGIMTHSLTANATNVGATADAYSTWRNHLRRPPISRCDFNHMFIHYGIEL